MRGIARLLIDDCQLNWRLRAFNGQSMRQSSIENCQWSSSPVAACCHSGIALRPPRHASRRDAPRYPEYLLPTLPEPDPRSRKPICKDHDAAWRWFQSGDLSRAETGFQAVLKKSPQFYPSETALGYMELARRNVEPALERFDRVLQSNANYVPALVGRGEALLAASRETEALAAFESAVKVDPQLQAIARRVEVLRARALAEQRGGGPAGRAGEPARRGGAAVRAGDRRLAGERVPGARSRRRRGEAGKDRSGACAIPARRLRWIRPTPRRESASARFSTRAAIWKAP